MPPTAMLFSQPEVTCGSSSVREVEGGVFQKGFSLYPHHGCTPLPQLSLSLLLKSLGKHGSFGWDSGPFSNFTLALPSCQPRLLAGEAPGNSQPLLSPCLQQFVGAFQRLPTT